MTKEEFAASLARQGLTRPDLEREVEALTGQRLARSTLWRMEQGDRKVDVMVAAYLRLREVLGPPPEDMVRRARRPPPE